MFELISKIFRRAGIGESGHEFPRVEYVSHGRSGELIYVEAGRSASVYCEMSGSNNYDLLASLDNTELWSDGTPITLLEKERIREKCLGYTTKKNIRVQW